MENDSWLCGSRLWSRRTNRVEQRDKLTVWQIDIQDTGESEVAFVWQKKNAFISVWRRGHRRWQASMDMKQSTSTTWIFYRFWMYFGGFQFLNKNLPQHTTSKAYFDRSKCMASSGAAYLFVCAILHSLIYWLHVHMVPSQSVLPSAGCLLAISEPNIKTKTAQKYLTYCYRFRRLAARLLSSLSFFSRWSQQSSSGVEQSVT